MVKKNSFSLFLDPKKLTEKIPKKQFKFLPKKLKAQENLR